MPLPKEAVSHTRIFSSLLSFQMDGNGSEACALPVYRAVYDYWYTQVPSEFTRRVDELTGSPAHAAKKWQFNVGMARLSLKR